jgi:electron transfer flavoprotein beta subunit
LGPPPGHDGIMLNIIVCIKQVPDSTEVRIDAATGTMIREGLKGAVNPFDENAVEAALALRERHGGKVTALSMGIPSATEQLRHVLAMGADEAVLLSDRALAGADTLATAYALSMAIRKLADFDLILCGKQAIDGDTGQVGPGIAERLGIPQVTYAREIEVANGSARVKRMLEDGYELVEADLPALVTVVKQINEPRYPSVKGLLAAKRKEIPIWSAADIGADLERVGQAGSPTRVIRTWTPSHERQAEMLGSDGEAVDRLVERLRQLGVLPG